jgi:hypothetical protein
VKKLKQAVMKQSFLLHINASTNLAVSFEEIMFLSSVKANQLGEVCEEINTMEIKLSSNDITYPDKTIALVKMHAQNGEYIGYSRGWHWESALNKAFDSIRQQIYLLANFRVQENTD